MNVSIKDPSKHSAHDITAQELLTLGVDQIVYIKPVSVEGETAYAVHAADGSVLSVDDSLAHASRAAQENDLRTVMLH